MTITQNDCIFCKIINGEFGTEFVLENEYAVVFKDINPKAPIHLLVVPRLHVESLNELGDKNLMGELLQTVKDVTQKIGLKSYKTLIKFIEPLKEVIDKIEANDSNDEEYLKEIK